MLLRFFPYLGITLFRRLNHFVDVNRFFFLRVKLDIRNIFKRCSQFSMIASSARCDEIIQFVLASEFYGINMVYFQLHIRRFRSAILTSESVTFQNLEA